ncbi:hypothetical protein [Brevundimonas sp.]|jgi:hypothetical protein|uniref:hypothetical protein n=1 Tax=Brevundimonas sp. TaxID=1871086 RepID=UPI0037C01D0F
MSRAEDFLVVTGAAGALALSLMLGLRLISAERFAQALGGGLLGLALVKTVMVISGGDHG